MTLNGRNEINKNSGAHQKNFNEDRPMSVVAKCRPMHLFVIYKVYANIRRGSIVGGGVKYNKCKRLADEQRGTYTKHVSLSCGLLGASHTACLGIGCIHNQHPIILDQCAECDLLKFVQIQIRVKQWTQA